MYRTATLTPFRSFPVYGDSRTLSELARVNPHLLPGRCPGLQLANAFGVVINGESSYSTALPREKKFPRLWLLGTRRTSNSESSMADQSSDRGPQPSSPAGVAWQVTALQNYVFSISLAWRRALAVISAPVSMRAISSTRL